MTIDITILTKTSKSLECEYNIFFLKKESAYNTLTFISFNNFSLNSCILKSIVRLKKILSYTR